MIPNREKMVMVVCALTHPGHAPPSRALEAEVKDCAIIKSIDFV